MNSLPEDDEKPIDFLQQYRPLPPPNSIDAEDKLIQAILLQQQKRENKYRKKTFFLISIFGTIFAATSFYWLASDRHYRFNIANRIEEAEVETVLADSLEEITVSSQSLQDNNNTELDWLLITGEDNPELVEIDR